MVRERDERERDELEKRWRRRGGGISEPGGEAGKFGVGVLAAARVVRA